MTRLNGNYDAEFLRDNDYFLKFLRLQRQLFLTLSEEMKLKIVTSLQTTHKIITESAKDALTNIKKV